MEHGLGDALHTTNTYYMLPGCIPSSRGNAS
ncbi:hypothetical protein PssB301D_03861 [Pseudomonas syringae pv. syringae str. B301D-R]|nr:hypothetical protein PsyrB_04880 [Pseudomonas syringae pv. syringae B301D]EXL29886.1 hypothetical protein PssB301D_03861 [Pseudomonas syringae pv. syringae str. B301D-R]SOQ03006.1 hypothetical protein CFBP2118_04256 [Pseudomonas syringae pv. syringae]